MKEICPFLEFDEDIHVALFAFFTFYVRAKNPPQAGSIFLLDFPLHFLQNA